MAEDNDDLLDPAEIEALLNDAEAGKPAASDQSAGDADGSDPAEPESASPPPQEAGGDTLSQADLDALLAEGPQSAASETTPASPDSSSAEAGGDLLDASEIERLLNAADAEAATEPAAASASSLPSGAEQLLEQAEAGLAAAVATEQSPGRPIGNLVETAQPFSFEDFSSGAEGVEKIALQALQDVELDLRIELGRTELVIDEVLKLRNGSIVPLDKLAGDPVDVLVNGRLIARGEVLVLNDNFCVRITEILTPQL